MSTEQVAIPGMAKMREGLDEFLRACADDGDMETVVNAVVIFETSGIEPDGSSFQRHSYAAVVNSGQRTSVAGLLEFVVPQIKHDLQCGGSCES